MRSVGLGAANGLIVSAYFFFVYGAAGLRLVLSPLVALGEKAHLGPALFVSQKLGLSMVQTVFFSGMYGTLKIAIASAFGLFLIRTLRAFASGEPPPEKQLENAIALVVAVILCSLWMAIAVGNSTALRLYSTELMLVLGAALILAVENLEGRVGAWYTAARPQQYHAALDGAAIAGSVVGWFHALPRRMVAGLAGTVRFAGRLVWGGVNLIVSAVLAVIDEIIIATGVTLLGVVLLGLRVVRGLRGLQADGTERLLVSWRWSHTWTRHMMVQAIMTRLELALERTEKILRKSISVRRDDAASQRKRVKDVVVLMPPDNGVATAFREFLTMRAGVRTHLKSWDTISRRDVEAFATRLFRMPGEMASQAARATSDRLHRAWRARLPH